MHATEESLNYSMNEAKKKGQKSLSSEEIADFEFEYGRLKYGLFRTCRAAFYEGLDLNQATFSYYGGDVSDKIDCDTQFYNCSIFFRMSLHLRSLALFPPSSTGCLSVNGSSSINMQEHFLSSILLATVSSDNMYVLIKSIFLYLLQQI